MFEMKAGRARYFAAIQGMEFQVRAKPTKALKAFLIFAVAIQLATRAWALSIVPTKPVYDPQEILWFSVTQSNLVTVSADSSVKFWDFASGKKLSEFVLPTNETPRLDEYTLAVSTNHSAKLAVIAGNVDFQGDINSRVMVFDASGRLASDFAVTLIGPYNCGFAANGDALILADSPPNNAVVFGCEATSGKKLWRAESDDDVQTGTIALADGRCYVNFCRDGRLRTRNHKGKRVWDWVVPKNKFAEPGYWPDSPALPYVVVFISDKTDDQKTELIALSAKDGSIVWREPNPRFGSLKAVSRDGRHQAFFRQGQIEITALPEQTKPQVVALHEEMEAIFSSDGHFLLCLPALTKISEDKYQNHYTAARHSSLMSVVSVETGKILKQFSLSTAVKH